MTTADVTSVTKRLISPIQNQKCWFYKYTKGATGDTLSCSSEFAAVSGMMAFSAAGATSDPAVYSGTTITLSAGTTTGFALVFGTG